MALMRSFCRIDMTIFIFDNVDSHIEKLGETYLAKIAGTPASTGLGSSGFAVSGNGE